MSAEIPEKNLFMMCASLNTKALIDLPNRYHIRQCRKDELGAWKKIHFDPPVLAQEYNDFMTKYYNQVYLPHGDLFFERCLFVCNINDKPIGTCFLWKSYTQIWTLQWFKVVKEYEGMGIGRALLSHVMKSLPREEYPVFLHTHPSSFRAIKLYSDVGFKLLTDSIIGNRKNELEESLSILEKIMPKDDMEKLQFSQAPVYFLNAVRSSSVDEF